MTEGFMRELPHQPDLSQLRRQARELQRAAARGEVATSEKVHAISLRVTLSSAQLALAREYGFSSWARLKDEIERRALRSPRPPEARYVVREVATLAELATVFDVIAGQLNPSVTHDDRRFSRPRAALSGGPRADARCTGPEPDRRRCTRRQEGVGRV